MKIGFLTPEFPYPEMGASGGIGTSIYNLAKGLTELGHEVSVIIYGQKTDEVVVKDKLTFYKVKNRKLKGFSRFLTQKKLQKLLNTLVKENQLDLVEAPDWTGITAAVKPNCPVVIRLNGSDTYFCHLDQRPVKFLNRIQEQLALRNADGLLSVSRYTAEVTQQLFGIKRQFEIIPNSIDLGKFQKDEKIAEQPNTILYFGTLIRKKGLLELPLIFNEVVKQNPEAKLILIGRDASDVISGNASTWHLMKPLFSKEAGKNVTYLGSVPYAEMTQHINAATVCVFPTFAEALPVSWIEAMAMQKAIVASSIGWAPEVIDDAANGFLVHPQSHQLYADKIVALLNDASLRTEFGLKARQKVSQKFSIEVVAKQSVAYYQKLLKP
ncbi:MAG: glycosyltransferase family 4 protein [Flavobacterium sp.]|uniref:glycosyltransferase family 4 protein n=1 Tax=Flavobacterium sp. TaxID=239 RepID=UPI00391A41A7